MADEQNSAEGTKTVSFTPEKLAQFKKAYTRVSKILAQTDSFMFQGDEYVLGYAKYLIQYLEMQFKR
jgi:adenosine deaminase